MTLIADIRSRLHSLSPQKRAEIAAISPSCIKILDDVDKLINVALAVKAEIKSWENLEDAMEALESPD